MESASDERIAFWATKAAEAMDDAGKLAVVRLVFTEAKKNGATEFSAKVTATCMYRALFADAGMGTAIFATREALADLCAQTAPTVKDAVPFNPDDETTWP